MAKLFRKILIRIGKIIPFLFASIIAVSYIEAVYATCTASTIIDADGNNLLALPISDFIGNIIYIDWFDVLIVWILCVALELCKYSFRCAYYITLNLAVRLVLETLSLENNIIIPLCTFMAILGLYCVYGGIRIAR